LIDSEALYWDYGRFSIMKKIVAILLIGLVAFGTFAFAGPGLWKIPEDEITVDGGPGLWKIPEGY